MKNVKYQKHVTFDHKPIIFIPDSESKWKNASSGINLIDFGPQNDVLNAKLRFPQKMKISIFSVFLKKLIVFEGLKAWEC